MKPKSQSPKLYSPEREDRVAEALRENLRKRKAQSRLRGAQGMRAQEKDRTCP